MKYNERTISKLVCKRCVNGMDLLALHKTRFVRVILVPLQFEFQQLKGRLAAGSKDCEGRQHGYDSVSAIGL